MPNRDQYRSAALNAANRIRKQLGLPPVDKLYPGYRNDPYSCPITETIYDNDLDRNTCVVCTRHDNISVFIRDAEHFGVEIARLDIKRLSRIRRFINTFDRGAFPDLNKGRRL